jgi:hypothetical protein
VEFPPALLNLSDELQGTVDAWAHEWRADAPKAPAQLWHYTNAAGAHGILTSRELFASHFSQVNDPGEVRLAETDLLRRARERASEHPVIAMFAENFQNLSFSQNYGIYVACLSEDGDLRSQWVEYGDGGRGFAIGFDAELLRIHRGSGWRMIPVRYGTEHCAWFGPLAEIIAETVDTHVPAGHELRDAAIRSGCDYLTEILVVALAVKHESFAPEREWRLVRTKHRLEPLVPSTRAAGGRLLSYVPMGIRDALNQIRLGPLSTPGGTAAMLAIAPGVGITESKLPFR